MSDAMAGFVMKQWKDKYQLLMEMRRCDPMSDICHGGLHLQPHRTSNLKLPVSTVRSAAVDCLRELPLRLRPRRRLQLKISCSWWILTLCGSVFSSLVLRDLWFWKWITPPLRVLFYTPATPSSEGSRSTLASLSSRWCWCPLWQEHKDSARRYTLF